MSTTLTVEPINAFQDNYIWLLHNGEQAAVVDPGDAAPVLAALSLRSLELTDILITHHHFDHTGGVETLKSKLGCKVSGPINPNIDSIDNRLTEGDTLTVLDTDFSVIEVPGHTLDHIAFVGDGIVFCGDTLFAGGCGRVFEGTFPMMRSSLGKLRDLPADTLVYCAHEYTLANLRFAAAADPENAQLKARIAYCEGLRDQDQPTVPSRIADELETNPFLRWDAPGVISNLSAKEKLSGGDSDDVFAGLRQWKDTF